MESLDCIIFLQREVALAVSNLRIICRKCVQELLAETAKQIGLNGCTRYSAGI
jgi:hypothetical protein